MSLENYRRWQRIPIEDRPWLSVVIPTFNERHRIVPTIAAIASHLSATREPWEMIISDDGSNDGTVALIQSLHLANVRVLDPGFNSGKGHAVKDGVAMSRGDLVLFTDADLSTPINELDQLVEAIRQGGADLAIGSRAAAGAEVGDRSLLRRSMSTSLRWTARTVARLHVADSQCGFKLFTRDAAEMLFESQTLDGFSFDLELLYLAEKASLEIAELPVHWIDAPGSKVHAGRESLRFLRDLAGIRLNDFRGRYPTPAVAA